MIEAGPQKRRPMDEHVGGWGILKFRHLSLDETDDGDDAADMGAKKIN